MPYAIALSYAENIAEVITYNAKLLTHFEPKDWDKFRVERITNHQVTVNIFRESLSLNKHDEQTEKHFVQEIKSQLALIASEQNLTELTQDQGQETQEVQESHNLQDGEEAQTQQDQQASSAKPELTAEQQAQNQAKKEARLLSTHDFYASKDLLTNQTNIYAVGDKTHTPLISFNADNSLQIAHEYIQSSKLDLIKMHRIIQAGHKITTQDLKKTIIN